MGTSVPLEAGDATCLVGAYRLLHLFPDPEADVHGPSQRLGEGHPESVLRIEKGRPCDYAEAVEPSQRIGLIAVVAHAIISFMRWLNGFWFVSFETGSPDEDRDN